MIPRPLWFLAGAGVGVYAVTKARQLAETFTVDGLRDRASAVAVGARLFAEEVSAGQAEKEVELRERFGLPLQPQHAALGAPRPRTSVAPGATLPPVATPAIHPTQQQENDL
ncbi:MAG: DUF6167 family protein [Nocardioides sp.]|uniref:DUF6167 family protein n=1 Tax=Nocardioides sp. TaxID=35761 RepID=UPI003F0C7ACA